MNYTAWGVGNTVLINSLPVGTLSNTPVVLPQIWGVEPATEQ